jgi:hypothetical protein
MTNAEIIELVSGIDGRDKAIIKNMVTVLIKIGQRHIWSEVPNFWRRVDAPVPLVAGDYLIDMRALFPDFRKLRFLYDSVGEITPIGDKKFRIQYPNDSMTGRPFLYFFKDDTIIQIFYRSDGARTIYANYEYRPNFDDASQMPTDWDHVLFYYIMSVMEGADKDYFKKLFANGLTKMRAVAAPSEESSIEILPEPMEEIIELGREDMAR